jgi:streptomycin 6-kinase
MSEFTDNIISIHGDKGRKWLEDLDSFVADLAQKWNLEDLKPFENLTFNYVAQGFRDDLPIVLKVGLEHDLLEKEASVLKFFENYSAIKIIDSAEGALLLQRAIPGTSLMKYFPDREDESIGIAADVIKRLHSIDGIPENSTPIEELLNDLYKKWNIPDRLISKAQRITDHLLKTTVRKVAMHGDLHHDNILRDSDHWKIIDPAGIVGDPIYEIASFMINPIDKIWKCENATAIIQNRIGKLSSLLSVDPKRIAQWTFVKSVLCWIWTLETPTQDRSQLAMLFDEIYENYHEIG